ncbi:MAG: hypothetical protein [Caudoviricetes sp.]|nr:MAG: hypothetical protein [Caudoviricetes sp.]
MISKLMELYSYNPENGVFTRIKKLNGKGRGHIGEPVGSLDSKGYLTICFEGKHIKLHRLAWAFTFGEFPQGIMDHVNGDRKDNRICNLREADKKGNAYNSKNFSNNKTGFKGVSMLKDGKYRAQARLNGKKVHLGRFNSAEDAAKEYLKFSIENHGVFSPFKESK